MWSQFKIPITRAYYIKQSVIVIIWLMLSLLVWPKVITLSGFHCISVCIKDFSIWLFFITVYLITFLNHVFDINLQNKIKCIKCWTICFSFDVNLNVNERSRNNKMKMKKRLNEKSIDSINRIHELKSAYRWTSYLRIRLFTFQKLVLSKFFFWSANSVFAVQNSGTYLLRITRPVCIF